MIPGRHFLVVHWSRFPLGQTSNADLCHLVLLTWGERSWVRITDCTNSIRVHNRQTFYSRCFSEQVTLVQNIALVPISDPSSVQVASSCMLLYVQSKSDPRVSALYPEVAACMEEVSKSASSRQDIATLREELQTLAKQSPQHAQPLEEPVTKCASTSDSPQVASTSPEMQQMHEWLSKLQEEAWASHAGSCGILSNFRK